MPLPEERYSVGTNVVTDRRSSNNNDLLQDVYYCQVENEKILNVVVELKSEAKETKSSFPQRFVLVIDVSGSMNEKVFEEDHLNLLDRMKIFAQQFIATTKEENWLAIIKFSDSAEEVLPMTLMNEEGKNVALEIVAELMPENRTNLSDGLFLGLNLASSAHPVRQSHDCIILFTDGDANEGIIESDELIANYKAEMEAYKQAGRINNIQLVAITLDTYKPYLLSEIRKHLSGDAFYVLNVTCDFEADMLIPLFLRETSSMSDILIDFLCVGGVRFGLNQDSEPGLLSQNGDVSMQYFIHSLPKSIARHIYLRLDVSSKSNMSNMTVLEIDYNYLDTQLKQVKTKKYLELDLTSVKEVRDREKKPSLKADITQEQESFMTSISVYMICNDRMTVNWESVQLAFSSILKAKSRLSAYHSVCACSGFVDNEQFGEAQEKLIQSIEEINGLKMQTMFVLGELNMYSKILNRSLDEFIANLQYGCDYVTEIPWARFQAMASSLETEMPTATGVFAPIVNQPFMPAEIEQKLAEITKKLNLSSQNSTYRESLFRREGARTELSDAIKKRNGQKLKTALENCLENGVDEKTIVKAEALLEVFKDEDDLIEEIKQNYQLKDIEKLEKLIKKFRDPALQFVDKTGEVKTADLFVKERRRLEQEAQELTNKISAAKKAENHDLMEKLIEELEAPIYQDAIDQKVIEKATEDLKVLRLELKAREEVTRLTEVANQLISKEELKQLKETLNDLKKAIDDKYFRQKSNATQFFEEATKKFESLQRKHKLSAELKEAWKAFNVPFTPDHLEARIKGIERVNQLKKRADTEKDNAFTKSDEQQLQKYTNEKEDLERKIKQRDTVHQLMKDAIKKYEYKLVANALKKAEGVLFLDEKLHQDCVALENFLNPDNRIEALRKAIESSDIDEVQQAIADYKKAKVTKKPGPELLKSANSRLLYLRKMKGLDDLLQKAIDKKDKEALRSALKQCSGHPSVKTADIPLFTKAENQFKLMQSGEFKYK